MTPVEIFEYKLKWKPGYTVRLHSDLESKGKEWCKQLDRKDWDFSKWTNVYEHTFHFQWMKDANMFKSVFFEYADQ